MASHSTYQERHRTIFKDQFTGVCHYCQHEIGIREKLASRSVGGVTVLFHGERCVTEFDLTQKLREYVLMTAFTLPDEIHEVKVDSLEIVQEVTFPEVIQKAATLASIKRIILALSHKAAASIPCLKRDGIYSAIKLELLTAADAARMRSQIEPLFA